jgi:hypothetical protein
MGLQALLFCTGEHLGAVTAEKHGVDSSLPEFLESPFLLIGLELFAAISPGPVLDWGRPNSRNRGKTRTLTWKATCNGNSQRSSTDLLNE